MTFSRLRAGLRVLLVMLVCGCGGKTWLGPGIATDAGGASETDGGDDTGVATGTIGFESGAPGGTSCPALGDCCASLATATDLECSDISDLGDDAACAAEVEKLQAGGECL